MRSFVLMTASWTCAGIGFASVSLPPPTVWKGIDYSPRRHSYFRMLYDWNQFDSVSNQLVSRMVDSDLAMLSQNGFNLVHLYLWDQTILKTANPNEPSGFVDATGDPSTSPNNQWTNLNDFVARAENYGIFVELHFASGWLLNNVGADSPNVIASKYANWAGRFIKYLSFTNGHKNVLLWGMAYGFIPAISDPAGVWSTTWQQVYFAVDQQARLYSPWPGALGLIGTDLNIDGPTGLVMRHSGYKFEWQRSQQEAYMMRSLLSSVYGYTRDPDIYLMQVYHANSFDMYSALWSLTNSSSVEQGIPISPNKISVVETATSSAMNGAPEGTGTSSYGDNQTPVVTVSGQASWVQNTFCMFRSLGIQKTAYWALYDPYTMWTNYPWYKTGADLSWNGYWGLFFEPEEAGQKDSWTVLRNYYYSGTLSCPSSLDYAAPILSLTPTSTYYTVGQPLRVTWTAADAASLSISQGGDNTYARDTGAYLTEGISAVSCAYTNTAAFYSTGFQMVTITGASIRGTEQIASAAVTIEAAPIVTAVMNQNNSYKIGANDTIILWGNGFSLSGGNTVQLSRDGYGDVWLYDGHGDYFWDQSNVQIAASLNGRAAPGVWNLYVRNGYSGTSSKAYQITINP